MALTGEDGALPPAAEIANTLWRSGEPLAVETNSAGLSPIEIRNLATDAAWHFRAGRTDRPGADVEAMVNSLLDDTGSSSPPLFWLYFFGQYYRFDFRHRRLLAFTDRFRQQTADDALLSALRFFAEAGLGLRTCDQIVEDCDRVLDRPDVDWRVRHVCLHSLDLCRARRAPGESVPPVAADRAVSLANEMLLYDDPGAANVHYRMARARRRLGELHDALGHIDLALEQDISDNHVHGDYVREREHIHNELAERQRTVNEFDERLADAREELVSLIAEARVDMENRLTQANEESRNQMRAALFSNIEVLSIFLVIVAFVFQAGALVSSGVDGLRETALLIGISGVVFGCLIGLTTVVVGRRLHRD